MEILQKARGIKLLILDVDGVLTNGHLYYGSEGVRSRAFHIHDGLGMKLLQQAGIPIAIISGKQSDEVLRRLTELQITHIFLGHENKRPVYESLKQQLGLTDTEIAYMGDDLPDLPLLVKAGLAITVADAPPIIQQHTDFITKKKGGAGAVREACDFILEAQNKFSLVLKSYLT
jgi:3-deoxy-D-manno-octulosonate 8-phosphate phosphatase (KDO 8-P phosphatase)